MRDLPERHMAAIRRRHENAGDARFVIVLACRKRQSHRNRAFALPVGRHDGTGQRGLHHVLGGVDTDPGSRQRFAVEEDLHLRIVASR